MNEFFESLKKIFPVMSEDNVKIKLLLLIPKNEREEDDIWY